MCATPSGEHIRRDDAFERAFERLLVAREGPLTMAGYLCVLNQNVDALQAHIDKLPGLSHPATQQVSRKEIVELYYDFALGTGGGALLPGRTG